MSVTGRVLVPWKEIRDAVAGLGLDVGVFTGEAPCPGGVDDVVFFTVPYDQPFGTEPVVRMPHVRVIQALTAGYDHLLGILPDGAALCNARGLHDASTAEHALGLILAAQRELPRWVRAQDQRHWEHTHTRSLAGSRVVIVGYGSIGAALGSRLRACEADVIAVARRPRPQDGVHGVADLDGLLSSADIVVLLAPLAPDTAGLMDARRLALLPDGALVVNVARGQLLDTSGMLAEAASGRLRAALDVTDPEPLPADHPLWTCPGVIITPHVAGGAAAFYPQAARFVADQIRKFAAGEPLANVVVPGHVGWRG